MWGGLLFLLNTATAAGLPAALADDVRLADLTTREVVHALALRLLPIAADDPAALALAGLPPGTEPPAPRLGATARDALDELVDAWSAATLARLPGATDQPVDQEPWTLTRLARRRGEIVADPGWLEVQLDLDEVDVAVRIAGLDLDPGFVRWLGAVVRVRYG